MTLIRIDPEEMSTTAAVLRGCAVEIGDLCGDLAGRCAACCLPASVDSMISSAVTGIHARLVAVAGDLGGRADELSARGAAAVNGSLATGASAAWGGPLSLDVAGIAGTAPVSGSDSGVRVDGSQVITTGDGVQIVVPPAIPAPTSTVFSGLDSGSVGLTTDNANSYLSPAFLNMVNGILSGGAAPSAPAIPSMRWPTLDSGPSFLAPSRDEIMNSGGGYHYISPAEYGDLHLGGFDSTLVL